MASAQAQAADCDDVGSYYLTDDAVEDRRAFAARILTDLDQDVIDENVDIVADMVLDECKRFANPESLYRWITEFVQLELIMN